MPGPFEGVVDPPGLGPGPRELFHHLPLGVGQPAELLPQGPLALAPGHHLVDQPAGQQHPAAGGQTEIGIQPRHLLREQDGDRGRHRGIGEKDEKVKDDRHARLSRPRARTGSFGRKVLP